MKKVITIFILLIFSKALFAHEDTYKAIELSNLHIKVMVGFGTSYQLNIIEAYAKIINEFILEIDRSEKVFIQFDEDYCLFKNNYYLLSYGNFKKNLIPFGFPFSYPYNLGFIKNSSGLNIIINQKAFKLKPVLQLIEYGLKNTVAIRANQNLLHIDTINIHPVAKYLISRDIVNNRIESIDLSLIDSIIQTRLSDISKSYLTKKSILPNSNQALGDKKINFLLFNDSIHVSDNFNKNLISLSTIEDLAYEKESKGLFLFDSDTSFYFLDKDLQSDRKKYVLSFSIKISCENIIFISYSTENNFYVLTYQYSLENEKNKIFDCFKPNIGLIDKMKNK